MEIEYYDPSFSHLFLIAILVGLLGFCGLGCWMEMKKCHTINKTDWKLFYLPYSKYIYHLIRIICQTVCF